MVFLAFSDGLEVSRDGLHGRRVLHPVEGARVDQNPFLDVGLRHALDVEGLLRVLDDDDQGKLVLLGELEVALVMGGNGHDAARAVVGQHEVGGVDGHLAARHRVEAVRIEEDALLLVVVGGPHELVLLFHPLHVLHDVLLDGLALGELHDERVLGRHEHEGGPVDRVLPRREDPDGLAAVGHGEGDLQAVALPDPVFLHGDDPLGPAREPVAVLQQLLHVLGDPEEPLREVLLLHVGAAAPALPGLDLLVGEHGLALRAPVDGRLPLVDEALLVHPQEKELLPLVVGGLAGRDLAVPVVAEAHAPELHLHALDVFVGPLGGVDAVVDGGVLGRHAEGVPSHGVKDVEAPHVLVAGDDIADGVIAHVPHVDAARGVGEHLQEIVLFPGWILGDVEDLAVIPELLPLLLDLVGSVSRLHGVLLVLFLQGTSKMGNTRSAFFQRYFFQKSGTRRTRTV